MDGVPARTTAEEIRTGDTVLVTRILPDGTVHRFAGALDLTGPPGGFSVTGEDLATGLRTRGYFLAEDTSPGTRQYVERLPSTVG
ncbi:hypothetical protein [Streptomyces sp. YS415]|uniref:hypothetical protein n=1 Tax=Streptomyces sp. YS415 TaxID=2944806 RepID=UPI0020218B07|nr:hypothetical protein [Streptomyces sp. YS415]MCL7430165.1 hypothetical protein [Streptomyces sp. YS415]